MQGMPSVLKKIAAPLILFSFLMTAFFSFAAMTYRPDGSMRSDCPFSVVGVALCPQSVLPGALHHLSALQSFLNVPVNFAIEALVIVLLLAALIFICLIRPIILPRLLAPIGYAYDSPPLSSRTRKINRWLSLLENSPSIGP